MCLNKYPNRVDIYTSTVIAQFMIPKLLSIPDCESVRRSHLQCVTPWSPWVVWLAVVTGGDCWSAPPVPDSATTLPPSSPSSSLHPLVSAAPCPGSAAPHREAPTSDQPPHAGPRLGHPHRSELSQHHSHTLNHNGYNLYLCILPPVELLFLCAADCFRDTEAER